MGSIPTNPGPGRPTGPATTGSSLQQKLWKWDIAIRYMIVNPNAQHKDIAAHVGVAQQTVAQWMIDPDFVTRSNTIRSGILSHLDEQICEDVKLQRIELKRAVPIAMQSLIDLALQRGNAQVRLKASAEILDRDGHFSKVSRIGLPTEDQGGISDQIDNATAATLIASLAKAQAAKEAAKSPTIESPSPTEKVQ